MAVVVMTVGTGSYALVIGAIAQRFASIARASVTGGTEAPEPDEIEHGVLK